MASDQGSERPLVGSHPTGARRQVASTQHPKVRASAKRMALSFDLAEVTAATSASVAWPPSSPAPGSRGPPCRRPLGALLPLLGPVNASGLTSYAFRRSAARNFGQHATPAPFFTVSGRGCPPPPASSACRHDVTLAVPPPLSTCPIRSRGRQIRLRVAFRGPHSVRRHFQRDVARSPGPGFQRVLGELGTSFDVDHRDGQSLERGSPLATPWDILRWLSPGARRFPSSAPELPSSSLK